MSMDLTQFYQTFFEESLELLDDVESTLVNADPVNIDHEQINTIFRGAHSIKGGASTFGFKAISGFTHEMETYLDLVRNHERTLNNDIVSLILNAVDALRTVIISMKNGETPDEFPLEELKQAFIKLVQERDGSLSSPTVTDKPSPKKTAKKRSEPAPVEAESEADLEALFDSLVAENTKPAEKEGQQWRIEFSPEANIFQTGNDPIRIFRELESLGTLEVLAHIDALPNFHEIDNDISYLSWTLLLTTTVEKSEIEEVFEWVADQCKLMISPAEEPAEIEDAAETSEESEPDEPKPLVTETSAAVKKVPSNALPPKDNASIRVSTEKVDALINLAGELVITQSMLSQMRGNPAIEKLTILKEGLDQLEHNSRELQESVMRIRMLPISFTFNRFPRMVRDLSQQMGKKVQLKISGESTELDKTVLEKINDPLVHLVRNSIDHGIESSEVRLEKGKDETGILHLNAYHQGSNIIIEIIDDGAGLNKKKILEKARKNRLISVEDTLTEEQIFMMIFQPGFSTAEKITDISGRGVGMDVVRRNIQELGGTIDVQSKEGEGSRFIIRLPLTLAILDGQLLRVAEQTFIIPLVSMLEIIQVQMNQIKTVGGHTEVYHLRDRYVPMIRLYEHFNIQPESTSLEDKFLVIVEIEGQQYGIVIDDLFSQQQVVIKNLEENYERIEGISGATILGDGRVALIVDVGGVVRMATQANRHLKQYNPLVQEA